MVLHAGSVGLRVSDGQDAKAVRRLLALDLVASKAQRVVRLADLVLAGPVELLDARSEGDAARGMEVELGERALRIEFLVVAAPDQPQGDLASDQAGGEGAEYEDRRLQRVDPPPASVRLPLPHDRGRRG